jgi:hypothetical protein
MMIRERPASAANQIQIENFNRAGHCGGGFVVAAGALAGKGMTWMEPSELTSTFKS